MLPKTPPSKQFYVSQFCFMTKIPTYTTSTKPFAKKRFASKIPPTRAALQQHTCTAILQGAMMWLHGFCLCQEWGCVGGECCVCLILGRRPSRHLIACQCKKVCTGRCSFEKATLFPCTALCGCERSCSST